MRRLKKQVVVIGQDVDLLVSPTALTPDHFILMLKVGKGKVKDRFYSSKYLQNSNLVIECKKSIIFLHVISGCDTTSGFYGKGKLQAVQLFNHSKYLQDIPEIFNNPKSTYTKIERAGERFIIALYSNTKKVA
ncbi:hypothetical protein AVEN_130173-1 [Araneus ventricosus]|uniref:Uncharacterized protein n=1 Tax=Araneus ventricosus TaxID=182803 RepID=A0A4Y2SI04_ARAVE|nr:hypothetical protein AVEN_130173-1 [Araneus ventricosus]